DHSMLTGIYAARNIMGERHDVWAVNTEQAYHEHGQEAEATVSDRLTPRHVIPVGVALHPASAALFKVAFAPLDPLALGAAVGTVGNVKLFLATAVLLLKNGPVVNPTLSLLSYYFLGFTATWSGTFLGAIEASVESYVLGAVGAWLWNA